MINYIYFVSESFRDIFSRRTCKNICERFTMTLDEDWLYRSVNTGVNSGAQFLIYIRYCQVHWLSDVE